MIPWQFLKRFFAHSLKSKGAKALILCSVQVSFLLRSFCILQPPIKGYTAITGEVSICARVVIFACTVRADVPIQNYVTPYI